jgi:hypothetical protein
MLPAFLTMTAWKSGIEDKQAKVVHAFPSHSLYAYIGTFDL